MADGHTSWAHILKSHHFACNGNNGCTKAIMVVQRQCSTGLSTATSRMQHTTGSSLIQLQLTSELSVLNRHKTEHCLVWENSVYRPHIIQTQGYSPYPLQLSPLKEYGEETVRTTFTASNIRLLVIRTGTTSD